MRFVIQVVTDAKVEVEGSVTGQIGKGYALLVGVGPEDNKEIADKMLAKLMGLRIFKDSEGKTNLSIKDVNGSLLVVSQFTLYADCRHGNRPSFTEAAKPDLAEELYLYIVEKAKKEIPIVETGVFGAEMKLSLTNDGPFTIVLDSEQIVKKKA